MKKFKKLFKLTPRKKEAFKESIKNMLLDTLGTVVVMSIMVGIIIKMLWR
jgi:hypothetical protein